jgi:hypothetical protein
MSRKHRRQAGQSAAFMVAPRATEFSPDYTHIRRDSRRIGVLAGTFFVILVGLSLFLR